MVVEDEIAVAVLGGSKVTDLLHTHGYLGENGVDEDRRVGEVVDDQLQDETFSAGQDGPVQLGAVDFPEQQHLGEGRRDDPQGSEEDSQAGNGEHGHPPDPEGKEVLLVEEVVAQDTEVVLVK